MSDNGEFPRPLTDRERELLLWVLPADRPGYDAYRKPVLEWQVAAQGFRGSGHLLLARAGDVPDPEAPLPQVLAYGMIETTAGTLSVTVRELAETHLDVEISTSGESVEERKGTESRRWTYSLWSPGSPCPDCGKVLRETAMDTAENVRLVLAVCSNDRRLWLHDGRTGINYPIPVTHFHNELMLHRQIRDPRVALAPEKFFQQLGEYSDSDLIHAFNAYNRIRTRVRTAGPIQPPLVERPGLLTRITRFFRRIHQDTRHV